MFVEESLPLSEKDKHSKLRTIKTIAINNSFPKDTIDKIIYKHLTHIVYNDKEKTGLLKMWCLLTKFLNMSSGLRRTNG